MVKHYFKPSFTRQFKKLHQDKKNLIIEAIDSLMKLLESGQNPVGLGLKRLSSGLWEIRASIKDRILFSYDQDTLVFILVGNHDDIIRHLKNN